MGKDWSHHDRRVAYWEGIGFPHSVAKMQSFWERRQAIVRMRDQGMTYVAISKVLHVTPARISEVVFTTKHHPQHRKPPVIDWLDYCGPIHRLKSAKRAIKMINELAISGKPQRDWMVV